MNRSSLDLHQDIRAVLEALGTTADAVYDALLKRGCLGKPGDGHGCVLACHLRRTLNLELQDLYVDGQYVRVFVDHKYLQWICVEMPVPCRQLAAAFDHGAYPDLTVAF